MITWFQVCEQGKFECDDEIYKPNVYKKKAAFYKYTIDSKYPINISNQYVAMLHQNLFRIRNTKVRIQYFETINYIIEAVSPVAHKFRLKVLKTTYKKFIEAIPIINKMKKLNSKAATQFIEKLLQVTDKVVVKMMIDKAKVFKLDIIRQP
jgi:hypothetical protein